MKKNYDGVINTPADGCNGYVAFYKDRQADVYANTLYEAKQRAVAYFKPGKKEHLVSVMIAEKDGQPVVHVADF